MYRDPPPPDSVEQLPSSHRWKDRFGKIQVLSRMEGGAIYSAVGEDSFWIIYDEGTMADFLGPEDADLIPQLLRLERYKDQERWIEAISAVAERQRRTFADSFESYDERRTRWQERFDQDGH
jgi:hypothetical protein